MENSYKVQLRDTGICDAAPAKDAHYDERY